MEMVLANLTVMSVIDEVDDVQSNSTNMTDFPDYDINDSFSHFEWAELAPVVVIYTLTFFLGLIGNVIIIVSTLCRLRPLPATPTNVFLGGLATADLLLIIFCIPVKIAKLFSYTWTMGIFLCKAVHYMQSVSAICSVVTLTAMSIERYYAIVHPMRAQYMCTISQARRIVIITWIAAFLLGIPMMFTQTHKQVGQRWIAYWCVRDSEAGLLWRAHEVYMLVVVLVLPLIIMAFCYTSICWEIWRVMKRRYHMTSRHALNPNSADTESIPMTQRQGGNERKRRDEKDEESRTMKQVVKMLVAVVVLFAICWTPLLVDNVLTAYGYLPRIKGGMHKHLNTAFQLMAYFNRYANAQRLGFDLEIKRRGVVNLKLTSRASHLLHLRLRDHRCEGYRLRGVVRGLALQVEKPVCWPVTGVLFRRAAPDRSHKICTRLHRKL